MEPVETIERNGYTARIDYDDSPESPRDWDNLGTVVTWHDRYAFGDRDGRREGIDPREMLNDLRDEGALVLPIYMYEHSGIALSTAGFADPWDSGQVGFIYASRRDVLKEYSATRMSPKVKEKALALLKAEVETLDLWVSGQVYAYMIEDAEGEMVDSCSGFYGLDDVRQEVNSRLDDLPHTLPLPEAAEAAS